jgi:hypothetical protein
LRNSCLSVARLFIITAVLFALVSSSVLADFSLRDWQYVKAISIPSELRDEGLVECVPDREVFTGSASGLIDIRIITGEDTEVPYKLEIGKAESQRTSIRVGLRDKSYVPGRYTTITAKLERKGIVHNEIEVETPSTDFGRTATVETSIDGVTWTIVAEKTVYDFTVKERRFTTRDTRVRYPDSTAHFVRVKIADEGGVPLEIAGAAVFFVKETLAREVPWPITLLGISHDTERLVTMVEVDLGEPGLPSYRLAVDVPEVNFFREVSLEVSANRERWSGILSQASIYAYNTPKFVGQNLSVTYPETTFRYLRLIIHDEDSPPLNIQDVKVWGFRHRLVFIANPEESYRLYYGNIDARQPSYDIERVFPYLVTEELPAATLGSQGMNPHFIEKKPPLSERFPWLLPTVIAVAAILVTFIIIGIIRQARKVLPPPRQ